LVQGSGRIPQRERQKHPRPISWVALDSYLSAVLFDDLLRDSKAQPGSLRLRTAFLQVSRTQVGVDTDSTKGISHEDRTK